MVLLRWWTDTCPFCERSLPALEELRLRHQSRGLVVAGVYHPKPPGEVEPEDVLAAARRLGFLGPLAIDADWSELRVLRPEAGRTAPTSASFLFDAAGTLRFVHPGPELHPSDTPGHERCDADFREVEALAVALLDEDG